MFQDRSEAGERVSRYLERYEKTKETLVLGIPCGGVIVASVVSRNLKLPMDVFISQKLRAPWDAELAMGAVTETGVIHINDPLLESFRLPGDVLADEIREQKCIASCRRDLCRGGKALPSLRGKNLILVDDGVATGATMLAAARSLRELGPKVIIAVVPAGYLPALRAIRKSVDEMEVLERSKELMPVHCYYKYFEPVTDAMVLKALAPHRGKEADKLVSSV